MAKLHFLFLVLVAILLEVVYCTRLLQFSGTNFLIHPRGGAKSIGSARKFTPTKAKKQQKKFKEHYDDDNDGDEDEDSIADDRKVHNRRSHGSKKQQIKESRGKYTKSSQKKVFSLIPWGNTVRTGRKSKSSGFSLRDKFEQLAKSGQSAYKEIYRRAKVLKSSAFEGILLKATWPSNDPVPSETLTQIVKYSIPAFKYTRDESEEDPYYMTLHKLWMKMSEKDWRTVVKSLYILHCISRDSSIDSCEHFAAAIKDLSKTKNPKKKDQKYFDIKLISEVDINGQIFQSFLKNYGNYVLYRLKTIYGKFQQFLDIITSYEGNEKKVLSLLKKSQQLIKLGLQVEVKKEQLNMISGMGLKLVASDLKDIWNIYGQTIAAMVGDHHQNTTVSDGSSTSTNKHAKEIAESLRFYQEYNSQIKGYLTRAAKSLKSLKIKFSADLESPDNLSEDALAVKIAELTSISGGATNRRKEEEDEEEEDDYEDGDQEDEEEDDEGNEDADVEEDEGDGETQSEEDDDAVEEGDNEDTDENDLTENDTEEDNQLLDEEGDEEYVSEVDQDDEIEHEQRELKKEQGKEHYDEEADLAIDENGDEGDTADDDSEIQEEEEGEKEGDDEKIDSNKKEVDEDEDNEESEEGDDEKEEQDNDEEEDEVDGEEEEEEEENEEEDEEEDD